MKVQQYPGKTLEQRLVETQLAHSEHQSKITTKELTLT